ncbi:MAG: hypothetical protein MRY78_01375 [Saprospiraceae bacterium]|nr:hypothetical protein [Saprospiraceae bacterium]
MNRKTSSLKYKSLAIFLTLAFHLLLFAGISYNGQDTFWLEYLPENIQELFIDDQPSATAESDQPVP